MDHIIHRPDDYEGILAILERAFGDPNCINNARSELFRLRQTNKDFGFFFAEFHRLALESEMNDDALTTILEQAVSKEVKELLINNNPLSCQYLELAKHIQTLENRRQYYSSVPALPQTFTTPAAKPVTVPTATRPAGEPMDLSTQRLHTPTDKETGNCFRCHKSGHQVKDCRYPDT